MNSRRKITIKDVARSLRISVTTVSRALRGHPGMSEATRERVRRSAQKLGYVPNPAGAALSTGRMSTIVFVVPFTAGRFPSLFQMEVLEGLTDEVAGSGYNVTVVSERYLQHRGLTIFEAHKLIHADGFVLLHLKSDEIWPQEKFPVPVVIVNREIKGYGADFVVSDDEHGAYLATRHLIDLGHKAIAQVTGPLDNYNLARRFQGFQSALSEAGLVPAKELMIEATSISRESGQSAIQTILSTKCEFSALFCGADIIAIGVMEGLRQYGLRIPADVSVVSFDNESFADLIDPPLTTVRKPRFQMGKEAGRLLMMRIAGDRSKQSKTIQVSTELIKRSSTSHFICE